jgi:hypothetical protein
LDSKVWQIQYAWFELEIVSLVEREYILTGS